MFLPHPSPSPPPPVLRLDPKPGVNFTRVKTTSKFGLPKAKAMEYSAEEGGAAHQLISISSDSSDYEGSPVKRKVTPRSYHHHHHPSSITKNLPTPKKSSFGRPIHGTSNPPPPPSLTTSETTNETAFTGSPTSHSTGAIKMIGSYTPRARKKLIEKYMEKRKRRLSRKTVRYRVRKTLANARPRVKGRFVKTDAPLTAASVEKASSPPAAENENNNNTGAVSPAPLDESTNSTRSRRGSRRSSSVILL